MADNDQDKNNDERGGVDIPEFLKNAAGAGHRVHNLQKDPSNWRTGNDPATEAQISFAETLLEETDEARPDFMAMSKSQISEWIQTHTGSDNAEQIESD